jgi:hypothetical protein
MSGRSLGITPDLLDLLDLLDQPVPLVRRDLPVRWDLPVPRVYPVLPVPRVCPVRQDLLARQDLPVPRVSKELKATLVRRV